MQAIVETLFDVLYLASVITVGVLMIRGSRGSTHSVTLAANAPVAPALPTTHMTDTRATPARARRAMSSEIAWPAVLVTTLFAIMWTRG